MAKKLKKRIAWNKGKKLTKKHKENISKAMKGRSAWNKSRRWQEEVKKKISKSRKGQIPWNKGIPRTGEAKRKIRITKLIPEKKFSELYDILETNFGGRFQIIDQWILDNRPDVPIINCGRGVETLPTHIRHCIHHKGHGEYSRKELIKAKSILSELVKLIR